MRKVNLGKKLFSIMTVISMVSAMMTAGITAQAADAGISISAAKPSSVGAGTYEPADGRQLKITSDSESDVTSGKVYAEYDFYVKNDGYYTFSWCSSKLEGEDTLSAAAVSLNGETLAPAADDGSADTKYNYSVSAAMDSGVNTIRFTPSTAVSGSAVFYLDDITITPVNVINNGAIIIEAESYKSINSGGWSFVEQVIQSENCYNNTKMQFLRMGAAMEITYDVYAPESGLYNMTVYGGGSYSWISDTAVTVNDTYSAGTSATLKDGVTSTGVDSVLKQTRGVCYIDDIRIDELVCTEPVALNKGVNKVVVRDCEEVNNWHRIWLDRIEFSTETVGNKSFKFEAEDTAPTERIGEGTAFSGGKYHALFKYDAPNKTEFFAPAGEYELYIDAGAYIDPSKFDNCKYLGYMSVAVDDKDAVVLSAENTTYIAAFSDNAAKWKLNENLVFDEAGEHSLSVTTTDESPFGNNYIQYDCFEIVPKGVQPSYAELTAATNMVEVGAGLNVDAKLLYENNYICGDYIVESVSYTSSDDNIAIIDDGVVYGINPGTATVTVTFTSGGKTYSDEMNVTVYDESGIIVAGKSYENGKAVVKLANINAAAADADVIISAYSTENGKETTFVNAAIKDSISIPECAVATMQEEISGDYISAFVWDSVETMKPITDVIFLK